jgi:hypothetical protein
MYLLCIDPRDVFLELLTGFVVITFAHATNGVVHVFAIEGIVIIPPIVKAAYGPTGLK